MSGEEASFQNGQLSYVSSDCEVIPSQLIQKFGEVATRIDLSDNCLTNLTGLEKFVKVKEVVLDKNGLNDETINSLPSLPTVETLSLNKNKIRDLENLLCIIQSQIPNLTYLSLLGNEACPDQLSSSDTDEDDYRRYRLYILCHLPKLRFLDFSPFKESDRREATLKGPYLKVVRPSGDHFKENGNDREQEATASDYKPLPNKLRENPDQKATFGKSRYIYYGRHSEGNRFIRNNDL